MEFISVIFIFLFYGLILAFIGTGIVQPIGAICRLIATKRMDSHYAIGLKKYLLAVLLYFLILVVIHERLHYHGLYAINLIYFFIVPIFYAIWYISFTRKWKIKKKNIAAYDQIVRLRAPHEDRLLLDSFPKKKIIFRYPNIIQRSTQLQRRHTVIRSLPKVIH